MLNKKVIFGVITVIIIFFGFFSFAQGGDNTKPIIKLIGSDSIKVVLGYTTYTDEGATVTDDVDKDRTIDGVLSGKTNVIGTYYLNYNASDSSSNVADEVTRTINVLSPEEDEDGDGFTNLEEVNAKTDFNDKNSFPGDTVAPIITFNNYIKTPTNQNITVVATTNEGTLNVGSHLFATNGSFSFTATDDAGNATTRTVTITNIDKTAPVITLGDYVTTITNKDVTVTVLTDEGTLNTHTHTFTENGSFDFVATDAAGNVTTKTVEITNIDKTAPVITLGDYVTTPTNQDVIVTATTNEGTLNVGSHLFAANGSFDFVATDTAGNVTTKTVEITNIDKTASVITLGDYVTTSTNQDVIVTATTNEGTLNVGSHLFAANGSFDFVATDDAGNVTTKTVIITNIDKEKPNGKISYNNIWLTNEDVIVTLTINEPTKDIVGWERVEGTNNVFTKVFTQNTSLIENVKFEDLAGNTNRAYYTVLIIDKKAPTGVVTYSKTNPTNNSVKVTLVTSEPVKNIAGWTRVNLLSTKFTKTFNDNASGDVYFQDLAGNQNNTHYIITNIDKTAPVITIGDYVTTPTNQDVIVTASTNEGTLNEYTHTFILNGSFDFVATDDAGNVTTKTVTVTNIDKTAPERPVNVSPSDGASVKGNSITNEWTSVPDAVKYIYESYHDISATSLRHRQTVNAPSHSKTATNIGDGTFWWRVKAVDAVGNESAWSVLGKVIVDSTPPVITIGDYVTTLTNQDVIVTASTNEGTLNEYTHTFILNGSFDFVATDDAGNVTTKTVTITNIDKEKPVIVLVGDSNVNVGVNSTYTDAGATVTDNNDTILVAIATSTVNTSTVGIYTVKYNVTDTTGNVADEVTRIVNVVDTELPFINLNGGDMTMVVGETFTDPGVASVSDNYASLTIDNVVKTGTVNINVAGTYVLTYTLTDGFNTTNITRKVTVKPLINQLLVYNPNEATKYNGFNISFNRNFVVSNPSQIKIQYEYSIDGGSYILANLVKYPGFVSSNSTYVQEEYKFSKDFIFKNKPTYFYAMLNANGGKILTDYFETYFVAGTIAKDVVVSMQEHNVQDRLRTAYNAVQSGKTVLIRTILTFKLENGAIVTYTLDPVKYN